MKQNIVKTIICCAIFTASGVKAQEGAVYPFKFAESLATSYDQGTSEVYPGVIASINNAELKVNPTNTLFVAPKRAKVAVASFAANEFSGCQEIKNDSIVTDELSAAFLDESKNLRQQSAWILELETDVLKAKRECKEAVLARSPEKTEICAVSKELSDLRSSSSEEILPTLKKINEIRDIVSTRLDTYGNQYGGTATAIVELWDRAEIDDVKQRNPDKNVLVVPIRDVSFNFIAGLEKNSALGEVIPRRNVLGFSLPSEAVKSDSAGGSPQAVTSVKTGKSTALLLSLSRLGACSKEDLIRAGTFNYKYDTFGYIRGEATYNKFDFYKRVKTKTTKNGFFTTKTTQSVVEEATQSESLRIAAMGDDLVSKNEMRERLLKAVEKRIMGEIATQVTSETSLEAAPKPGASSAGDALLKCPDWRCQVGGYVLKTAADIWGKGTTEDAFEKKWNYDISEKWSETTMHTEDGSSSAEIRFN